MSRLLWADDQVDAARTLSQHIGPHMIEFVASGEEAIQALMIQFFDLALVDLSMPPGEWGGLWLLEEMKRRSIFAPVVVISGEGTQAETIKAIRLGAIDYVTKENAEGELQDRVRDALVRSSATVESIGQRPTAALVAGAETRTVEFKESARWNTRAGLHDRSIEQGVVKTIAGFLNSAGGTLVIGVTDSREVVGLSPDFALFGKEDPGDAFVNWLTTLLAQSFGEADAALTRIRLEEITNGAIVCRVDVPANSHPAFVATEDDSFFVRFDNTTLRLNPRQTMDYVQKRWPVM